LLRIWHNLDKQQFNALNNNQVDLVAKIEEISKFISIWHTKDLMNFQWDKYGTNLIYELIRTESRKCDVFLIDPLQALETRSKSDELYQEQGNIIKNLQEQAEKRNKIVIITHHIRKAGNSYKQWKTAWKTPTAYQQ
jgi:predicted metallo-beta-lactamase superfamily hydrolase